MTFQDETPAILEKINKIFEKITYFDTFFCYFSRFLAVDRDLLTFERTFLENGLFPVKEIFRVVGTPISLTISILYFTLDINFIP